MTYRFRGDKIGEQACQSCNGNTQVFVFKCRLHGACTEAKPVWPESDGHYRVCNTCPDRDACAGLAAPSTDPRRWGREKPDEKPDVSFVITARNEQPAMIDATIQGLLSSTRGHKVEIILVDDGSDVPIQYGGGAVRLLREPSPSGVSRARRQGTELAKGKVLVWMDAHMTFSPGWLDRMLEHVDTGSLLCSEFWSHDLKTCHCWGAEFTWQSERDWAAGKHPGLFLQHRTQKPAESGAVDVPMIIGACYMMSRESCEKVGGFSPLFKVWGMDEQDLSARAWLAGLGVKCVVGARVGHFWRPAFPYPVQYEFLEFNQLMTLLTVFDERTIADLRGFFDPVPSVVESWIDWDAVGSWRRTVQAARKVGDQEFFDRFLPGTVPSREVVSALCG